MLTYVVHTKNRNKPGLFNTQRTIATTEKVMSDDTILNNLLIGRFIEDANGVEIVREDNQIKINNPLTCLLVLKKK
jgi:hypothetical protein